MSTASRIAKAWDSARGKARDVRAAIWREALDESDGNITRAGEALGVGKGRAMNLTAEFGLNEYARELRYAAGYTSHTGRPPRGV